MKKDLGAIGAPRHSIDDNGNVYGMSDQLLQYQYTSKGYRSVAVRGITYRIDHLMGLVFKGIPIEKRAFVQYEDDDRNNVSISNLKFVENS